MHQGVGTRCNGLRFEGFLPPVGWHLCAHHGSNVSLQIKHVHGQPTCTLPMQRDSTGVGLSIHLNAAARIRLADPRLTMAITAQHALQNG